MTLNADPLWVEPDDSYFYRLPAERTQRSVMLLAFALILSGFALGVAVSFLLS